MDRFNNQSKDEGDICEMDSSLKESQSKILNFELDSDFDSSSSKSSGSNGRINSINSSNGSESESTTELLDGDDIDSIINSFSDEVKNNRLCKLINYALGSLKTLEESYKIVHESNKSLQDSNRSLQDSNKSLQESNQELIRKNQELIKSNIELEKSVKQVLDKVNSSGTNKIIKNPQVKQISNVWRLDNYSNLRKCIGQMHYSRTRIEIGDYNFQFAFCLNGVNKNHGGYLSLFIFERDYKPVNITLTVTLSNFNFPTICPRSSITCELPNYKYKLCSFGWNRFYPTNGISKTIGYIHQDNYIEFEYTIIINQ